MIRVVILVPERAVMQAIADPRYMFTAVNGLLMQAGKEPLFTVTTVGLQQHVALADGLFTVNPDHTIDNAPDADLVFLPAIGGDLEEAVRLNAGFYPWVVGQYSKGAEIASLCLGAFLFAATGLLNGRKCSTHWLFAPQFRAMYPEVQLVDQKIIAEENGLYSSGGANSYWNLLLYLVEKYTDRDTAILASKFFVIETMRNNQSPFIIFKGQKTHKDETVRKAQEYIEQHFDERISLDDLARQLATGKRSLERRFKKATDNTISEYVQRVKVEAAKKRFETGLENVNEVMYAVGYSDAKAFRATFKKVTGLSPMEYRNKYQKEQVV